MELTGERTLPGLWHENYWFQRHLAGYRWAAEVAGLEGAVVVEAGVGEGYGAALLAERGPSLVVGVDLDPVTLEHVTRTYAGVAPLRANLVALPLRDASVDVVVSAQTVEHLWDQRRFVAECARVLRPGGRLVLTTPNRLTFPPGNVFHHRELDAGALAALVADEFTVEHLNGLGHGAALRETDRDLEAADGRGGLVAAQLARPHDAWPGPLRAAVTEVRAEDFEVGPTDGCLDLLLAGTRR